jgi:hypothetical protein
MTPFNPNDGQKYQAVVLYVALAALEQREKGSGT